MLRDVDLTEVPRPTGGVAVKSSEVAERFATLLERHRHTLLALMCVHQFAIYCLFIGMPSWDGFTYRVPPIVELVQHGSFGFDKYNQWAFLAYVPFIELTHAPFLYIFGLRGVLIGSGLVVLPICVAAVHSFALKLTGNRRSAFFGAAAYAMLPLVGEGAYSGYVDFVVCALLCFFLDSALRVLAPERRPIDLVRFAVATVGFTLSRGQAVYVAGVLLAVLAGATFTERDGARLRPRQTRPLRELAKPCLAFGVGAIPALGLQVFRLVKYGGPIFPYQFQLFGVALGTGVPMKSLFSYAGIPDDSARSLASAFVRGWLWSPMWPPVGYYDSRNLGAGFVMWIMFAVAIPAFRALDRRAIALIGTLAALSFFARDFCHPRWASTLIASVVVIVGAGMAQLLASRVGRLAFIPLVVVLFAHALRPELEVSTLKGEGIGPRSNIGSSPWFIEGKDVYDVWPDRHAQYLIVQERGFVLPMYGPRLTNEVLKTVPGTEVGSRCERLIDEGASKPNVLVIDDLEFTKDCDRTCAHRDTWHCVAWRLRPPRPDRPAPGAPQPSPPAPDSSAP